MKHLSLSFKAYSKWNWPWILWWEKMWTWCPQESKTYFRLCGRSSINMLISMDNFLVKININRPNISVHKVTSFTVITLSKFSIFGFPIQDFDRFVSVTFSEYNNVCSALAKVILGKLSTGKRQFLCTLSVNNYSEWCTKILFFFYSDRKDVQVCACTT